MRKVDNSECKVISLIVDADTERCGYVASLDICVEITPSVDDVDVSLSSNSDGQIALMQFPKFTLLILNKSSMYLNMSEDNIKI